MIACLGGFCASRETCADYQRGYGAGQHQESRFQIVERLCGKVEEPQPMNRIVKREEENA